MSTYDRIREAPNNIEAEQALLGAILVNNAAYHAVSGMLDASHHWKIFEVASDMIRAGKEVDPILIKDFLPTGELVGDMTVMQYLARLARWVSEGVPLHSDCEAGMSNRAWMPLHIDDYLADTGHLTGAEHGAYMLLIMHYWQNGSLPENERLIARIARMDAAQWEESREILAMLFGPDWTHRRIDAELAKADEIIEKRRAAANARHKRSGKNADALQVQSKCIDTGALPLTHNHNYAASARVDDISARMPELYAALGVTDETKSPGLLAFSEPIQWVSAGCDVDADILPALRAIAARGKVPRSWSYCSNAVFEARDRRLAPAPAVQRRPSTDPPRKPRNAGEAARLELIRRGEYRNASSQDARLEDARDGNAGFAGTDIARRLAIAASG